MKLQKLVYYSQAWSLVWDGEPLFDEKIQAWVYGPVVYELYEEHRGTYHVGEWPRGEPDNLTPNQRETVDAVLAAYGDKSAFELSSMTHSEDPWKSARAGLDPGEQGGCEITLDAIHEYYSGLLAAREAHGG